MRLPRLVLATSLAVLLRLRRQGPSPRRQDRCLILTGRSRRPRPVPALSHRGSTPASPCGQGCACHGWRLARMPRRRPQAPGRRRGVRGSLSPGAKPRACERRPWPLACCPPASGVLRHGLVCAPRGRPVLGARARARLRDFAGGVRWRAEAGHPAVAPMRGRPRVRRPCGYRRPGERAIARPGGCGSATILGSAALGAAPRTGASRPRLGRATLGVLGPLALPRGRGRGLQKAAWPVRPVRPRLASRAPRRWRSLTRLPLRSRSGAGERAGGR